MEITETLTDIMNGMLWQLVTWCEMEDLRVNASKMVIVPFTSERKCLGASLELIINVLLFPVLPNIW